MRKIKPFGKVNEPGESVGGKDLESFHLGQMKGSGRGNVQALGDFDFYEEVVH